jgi:O-antigen/teichoic acid export membrane protein
MSYVALVVAVGGVIGNATAGAGRMWHAFWINGLWLVAFVATGALLVPRWSALGLATAFLLSYLFLGGVFWAYSRLALRTKYDHSIVLLVLTVLSAVAALVARQFLDGLPLFAAGLLIAAIIVVVEWRAIIGHTERAEIKGIIQRLTSYRGIAIRVSEPS